MTRAIFGVAFDEQEPINAGRPATRPRGALTDGHLLLGPLLLLSTRINICILIRVSETRRRKTKKQKQKEQRTRSQTPKKKMWTCDLGTQTVRTAVDATVALGFFTLG